jgi:two-component system OmpR family response regulator
MFHVHEYPLEPKRARVVFLIDDDPLQLEMMADFINKKYKLELHTFSSGEEALAKIDLRPEVIILDYHLNNFNPDAANGAEILKKIKERTRLAQVIILSGQDNLSIATDCLKYGAFDYIVKGESAFKRLEQIFNNIDQMMDDIYFRKFNSDMLKLLVGVIILGTGFVLYAINAGMMKVTFHF